MVREDGSVCGWAGGEWTWWRWVVVGGRSAWGGVGSPWIPFYLTLRKACDEQVLRRFEASIR